MAGPFEFLHIKRSTEGSSNELSFDVLDAARDGSDEQEKRMLRSAVGPKPSQGSYHGVMGTSTLSSAPEVERRKRARRVHTARVWAIAVVAVAALIGAGAYLGFQVYQDKMDFKGHYVALTDRLAEADKTLVNLDGYMDRPLKAAEGLYTHEEPASEELSADEAPPERRRYLVTATGEEAEALASGLASLKRELNSVSAEAGRLKDAAANDEDLAALSQVQIAAEARSNMVDVGGEALDLMVSAGKRIAEANAVWNKVLKADGIARDAAEIANSATTEEATRLAANTTDQARSLLMEAREELAGLEKERPKLDYSDESRYVEKRIEAMGAALRTSESLLSNNREAASKANDEYNAKDREAVELAAHLPQSQAKKVAGAYEDSFDDLCREYDDARALAANADSAIRLYG